jgi:hypothetical protein
MRFKLKNAARVAGLLATLLATVSTSAGRVEGAATEVTFDDGKQFDLISRIN